MKDLILQWINQVPYIDYIRNNIHNKYVLSLLIFIGFVILAKILLFIFVHYIEKFAAKTKTNVDDLIISRIKTPLFYLIIAYGIKLAILNLGLGGIFTKLVHSLMSLVFVLIIARSVGIAIDAWGITFARKTRTNIDDVLMPLFHKATNVVFIIVAVLWVLAIWEINITPYLAGAGIAGLVLGMALQDSLKNVFGGIMLILDKTYKIGDKVKLESGEIGTVHDIGLRSTKIITPDNEIIYVPNGYLANSRVQNFTRPSPKVRVNVNFGVEYGTEAEKVRKTVLAVLRSMKIVLKDPQPSVDFLQMGDFSLHFVARFWVEKWDMSYSAQLEATEKIYNALNKAEINMPFPTQTVYLRKE